MTVAVELLILSFLTEVYSKEEKVSGARCPRYMKRELVPQQEGLVAERYKHTNCKCNYLLYVRPKLTLLILNHSNCPSTGTAGSTITKLKFAGHKKPVIALQR